MYTEKYETDIIKVVPYILIGKKKEKGKFKTTTYLVLKNMFEDRIELVNEEETKEKAILFNWYTNVTSAYLGVVAAARRSMKRELEWHGDDSGRYQKMKVRYENTLASYKKWKRGQNGKKN